MNLTYQCPARSDETHQSQNGMCSKSIEHAAVEELAAMGYAPLKQLRCGFRDGTLTLRGQVSSYYHKQLAQEAVRRLSGIRAIVNEVTVRH